MIKFQYGKRMFLCLLVHPSSLLVENYHPANGATWWWQHLELGCFSSAETGNLVRVARKTNEGKDRAVLEEKMLSKRLETGLEVPLLVKQQT